MRKGVKTLIDEMKGKLSGYAVLLVYRYANLCIKAEAMSLLSIYVKDEENDEYNLDEVASAMLINEYQFRIIPHETKMVFYICKAFQQVHPEFKQEVVSTQDSEDNEDNKNKSESQIICTMPEVNKNRHDLLMDVVDMLYKECDGQIKQTYAIYQEKLALKMVGQSEEDTNEAKESLEEVYTQHTDITKGYKEKKEKEIEDAYQKYLDEQNAKEQKQQEEAMARGEGAGQSMKFDDTEE